MQTVEKLSPAITNEDHEQRQRLTQWRQQREKIAEISRQERQRQEENERQERMLRLERARISRAVEEAENRSQSDAAERAERMIAARNKLSDRADLDATIARMQHAARRRRKVFAAQVLTFLILPIAAAAYYIFALATPMVTTETRFKMETDIISPDMLADLIRSPMMFQRVAEQTGYAANPGPTDNDMIAWLQSLPERFSNPLARYRRDVTVATRHSDGAVTLTTRAPTPELANSMAQTILGEATQQLRDVGNSAGPAPITIYQPTRPTGSATVAEQGYKFAFAVMTITATFLILGSGFAALRRHSMQ